MCPMTPFGGSEPMVTCHMLHVVQCLELNAAKNCEINILRAEQEEKQQDEQEDEVTDREEETAEEEEEEAEDEEEDKEEEKKQNPSSDSDLETQSEEDEYLDDDVLTVKQLRARGEAGVPRG